MRYLSEIQKKALLENPHVEEVTANHIHYSGSFKIKAVEGYLNGEKPNHIFQKAGIDPSFFEENYCLYTLKRWKKKYEQEGPKSLKVSNTGQGSPGRPLKENLDELSYEELQTIVEIQRKIIAELELKKKLALAKKK
jgi:transposase